MKKSILILGALLIALPSVSFGQKHNHHHHKPHFANHHHKPHFAKRHHNFFGGVLTGFLFSEIFHSASHSHRKMYFKYKPYQDTWKLQRDFTKNNSVFHNDDKVVAKFENPSGGRDFVVTINEWGDWELDCPKNLARLFKNKIRKNL